MTTVETAWQERSNWAAEQAAKLQPRFPTSGLPWDLQCGINRDRMARHHLSWLELVTGIPYSTFEKALGGMPPQHLIATAEPVAKLIWQLQGCPPPPVSSTTTSPTVSNI
jgi:hypothetical protein